MCRNVTQIKQNEGRQMLIVSPVLQPLLLLLLLAQMINGFNKSVASGYAKG